MFGACALVTWCADTPASAPPLQRLDSGPPYPDTLRCGCSSHGAERSGNTSPAPHFSFGSRTHLLRTDGCHLRSGRCLGGVRGGIRGPECHFRGVPCKHKSEGPVTPPAALPENCPAPGMRPSLWLPMPALALLV